MFKCEKKGLWDDQVCLNQSELCDGKEDCPLGDDESEEDCSECSTKQCKYRCRNTPTGAKCECAKGYHFDSDGVSCVDLDECTLPERACHHFCENQIGSFRCSCAKGYHLKDDGKTCELSDISEGFLLRKDYDEIKRKPLEDFTGTNFTTVYKTPKGQFIRAFDYSRRHNKFFMSISVEEGEAEKFFMSISDREFITEKLVVEQNGTLRVLCENALVKKYKHLAVDWIGNNLFFHEEEVHQNEGKNSSRNFISVCTINGKFYRRLIEVEDGYDFKNFVIDPMRGLLIWHDSAVGTKKRYPDRIMMANMDGSEVQLLLRSKSRISEKFAVDHVNHDIYYENKDEKRIRRVNIDTRKTEYIASNSQDFSDTMAYHNGFLYWHNPYGEFRVLEVARNGSSVHRLRGHGGGPYRFRRMAVNDSLHQLEPSTGNPCSELDCPWICVIVPDFTAKCLCPDGYTPSILGTTCIPEDGNPAKANLTHIGQELMSEYCNSGVGCLNGGSCRKEVSNKIVCDCLEPYDGLYCERRKPVLSDEAVLHIIPVIILLLLVIAISVGIYYFFCHRRNEKKGVTDIVVSFSNNVFENDRITY